MGSNHQGEAFTITDKHHKKKRMPGRKWLLICLLLLLLLFSLPFFINGWVVQQGKASVVSAESLSVSTNTYQCILVLGAGLSPDGNPSPMLKDRLDVAISLYERQLAPKLLLSGDHGKKYYDEVNAMLAYCLAQGVPKDDIFLDHAGFSTYESMVRAKKIFQVERALVVTQEYHLYRALYIGQRLGLSLEGVSATLTEYQGQSVRDQREFYARNKDFLQTLTWPDPTYLGEPIPITGDSSLSHDDQSK